MAGISEDQRESDVDSLLMDLPIEGLRMSTIRASPVSRAAPAARGGRKGGTPPRSRPRQSLDLPPLPTKKHVQALKRSPEVRASAREAFKLADVDGSGGLDQDEVRKRLHDCGLTDVTKEYIDGIFDVFDANGDGVIDLPEYEKLEATVIKKIEDRWARLERGDESALTESKPAGKNVSVHEDRRPLAFYEKTGLALVALVLAFVGLIFFMLSVDEVQEMAKQCDSGICQNGARCVDVLLGSKDEGTARYEFQCVCHAGYEGLTCDSDVDECFSMPCQNGGTCAEDVDEYSCSCVIGFTGGRCQTDIDECRDNPCINRGTCNQQTQFDPANPAEPNPPLGSYSCTCQDGYAGDNCAEILPTRRAFSVRAPCVDIDCDEVRSVEDATEILGAAFGVHDDNLVEMSITRLDTGDGDRVDFVLSTHNDNLNGLTVPNLLPAGWIVLEAEIQECDGTRDVFGSQRDCVALDAADAALCDAVDGEDLLTELACNQVTRADGVTQACEYVSDRATNLVDCIEQYGQLRVDRNLDLYILEDLSSSFGDDIQSLAGLSRKFVATLQMMFNSYRVGIGSFVDVGGYCYRNDQSLDALTAEQLQERISQLAISADAVTCPNVSNTAQRASTNPNNGESVTTGLFQVGAQHAELGFDDPSAMRVVLMSTDDYFKLGEDGDDVTGYFGDDPDGLTGCSDESYSGLPTYCSKINNVAEVRQALLDADIRPVFAIAGFDVEPFRGRMAPEYIDMLLEGNANLFDSYRAFMSELDCDGQPCDPDKFVMQLSADSSDFVEIAIIALRQAAGDLPNECLPFDECAEPDACGSGTCYDTPYGPKQCLNCAAGYAPNPNDGLSCTLDIDECCSSPCLHDGVCTDGVDQYNCECTDGWEGVNCAVDTDECATDPCQNDAVCLSSNATDTSNLIAPGEFECLCVAGYSGELCDVDVNECASVPCENRGACSESSTGSGVPVDAWVCTCVAGFEADDCSIDIDECASEPCMNGGVCDQPAPDSFGCECTAADEFFAAHFEGEFCETELPVDYTYLILAIVSGIVLIISTILACCYYHHKRNLVEFTVETLDREPGKHGGQIVVAMRMKTWNTIYDVVQELERREGIKKREVRLFFTPPGQNNGDDAMLDPSPKGPTLADAKIVTGSVVTLRQVWLLKVCDKTSEEDTVYDLPFVERHWKIPSVKLAAQRVSGITTSSMDLYAPGGNILDNSEALPSYPEINDGSILEMRGQRPETKAPLPPPVEKAPLAPSAYSVATMAGMFDMNKVPGSHLSALQEAEFIKSSRDF